MLSLETDPVFVAVIREPITINVTVADVSNLQIDGDRMTCQVNKAAIIQQFLREVEAGPEETVSAYIEKSRNPASYNDLFDLAQNGR